MSDRPRVVPVRVTVHDDELGCNRVRVVGYRFLCPCGERSARRDGWREAVIDLAAHVRAHGESGGTPRHLA